MELKNFKKEIDREINSFFENKVNYLLNNQNLDIDQLLSHVGKILREGKRIRPYMAYLTYKSFGGKEDKKAIKLLSFIEIFHLFCLVHDDIMDNAEKRHGVKTINKLYGNSQAILVGDFLFSWAWEILLTNTEFEKSATERTVRVFLQMIDEVFSGQIIDLDIASKKKVSNEEILNKMLLKTAGYSFIKPMTIGAYLAKDIKKEQKSIEEFGRYLGLAFQIQDDLLDLKFESKQTKKSNFNDVAQHQHTLFTNFVFERGTNEHKRILSSLFGKELSQADKPKLRKVFIDSGAINYGEDEVINNLTQAKKALGKIEIDEKYKNLFLKLITDLINRSS